MSYSPELNNTPFYADAAWQEHWEKSKSADMQQGRTSPINEVFYNTVVNLDPQMPQPSAPWPMPQQPSNADAAWQEHWQKGNSAPSELAPPSYVANHLKDPQAAPLYPALDYRITEALPSYEETRVNDETTHGPMSDDESAYEAEKPTGPGSPDHEAITPNAESENYPLQGPMTHANQENNQSLIPIPVAVPVQPNTPKNNRRMKDRIVNGTLQFAKTYTSTIDPAIEKTKKTGQAIGRFSSAFCSTSSELWALGGIGCVKEAAKVAVGAKHYNKALETMGGYLHGKIQSHRNPQEKMGFSEASGTACAYMGKCLTNVAITGAIVAGKGLYLGGTIYNSYGFKSSSTISIANAASHLAFGVNTAMRSVAETAVSAINPITEAIKADPTRALQMGYQTSVLGLTAAGMGTTLYFASTDLIKAAEAKTPLSKIKYGTKAAASLISAVAIPYFCWRLA